MAKIMLVEDDNNLREIYGARLLAEGHEIVTAKDGEEALATAVKEKPDLIISDVMMPRISGFDMLDILRNAPETKFTKVIMMTALSQAEDKARADSLGADRYLVKSQVTLEDVARVVKDVLEGKTENETTPAPAVAAEASASTTEPAATKPATETPTPEATTPPATEPTPTASATPEIQPIAEPPATDSTPQVSTPVTDQPQAQPSVTPIQVQADDPTSSTTATPSEPPAADDATTTTTDDTSTPTASAEPEAVETATPTPINVELPSNETEATPAADIPAPAVAEPPAAEEPSEASIGPNLTEALQAEAQEAEAQEAGAPEATPATTTVAPDTGNIVLPPEPTAEPIPSQPAQSAPELPVIEPPAAETNPEPATTQETAAPEQTPEPAAPPATTSSEAPTELATPDSETTSNPLVDDTRKKVVIQPIHDITKGPDLNALLEEEKKNDAVSNPGASTVITPSQPAINSAQGDNPPTAPNQHDVIAL